MAKGDKAQTSHKPVMTKDPDSIPDNAPSSTVMATLNLLTWPISARVQPVAELFLKDGPKEVKDSSKALRVPMVEATISANFLLAIYVVDIVSWGVGRTIQVEILWVADQLGFSIIRVAVVLVTIEYLIEFFASTVTIRTYELVVGTDVISTRRLARFSLLMYVVSNIIGLVLYSAIGAAIHFGGWLNVGSLYVMITFWAIQYPSINQIGDATVEMALPHWMETFRGSIIAFPGFPLRCCCGTDENAKMSTSLNGNAWRWNLNTLVSTDSLSLMLTLMRFTMAILLAVFYLIARDSIVLRWIQILFLCAFCATTGGILFMARDSMTKGILECELQLTEKGHLDVFDAKGSPRNGHDAMHDHKTKSSVQEKKTKTPGVFGVAKWPWQLQPFENALIWYAVLAFGVPAQAFNALLSLLTLRVSALVYGIVVVVALVSVIWYFSLKIKAEGQRVLSKQIELQEKARNALDAPEFSPEILAAAVAAAAPAHEQGGEREWCYMKLPEFSVWVILIWISVVLLGGSSIALLLGGSNGIVYVAVPLLLPFALLTQLLTARFDGYMFMHPEETSSDVQYWKNVFAVAVNGPVLIINWFALDQTNGEEEQLAVVVGITVIVYMFVGVYFGIIDRFMPPNRSLTVQIPRIRDGYKYHASMERRDSVTELKVVVEETKIRASRAGSNVGAASRKGASGISENPDGTNLTNGSIRTTTPVAIALQPASASSAMNTKEFR